MTAETGKSYMYCSHAYVLPCLRHANKNALHIHSDKCEQAWKQMVLKIQILAALLRYDVSTLVYAP